MGKLQTARRALRRGGTRELVQVSRRWLARRIDPGPATAPSPAAATPQPAPPPPRKHAATDVPYEDAVAWFGRRHGGYVKLAEAVRPYVDPAGVVLDVGANIGYFTKVLGETLQLSGTVHLFEPLPHLAALCRRTAASLPFRAVVHEFGLGAEDTTLDLYMSFRGNLGWNTVVAEQAQEGMTSVPVRLRRFDDVGIDVTPTLVKIDVEGAEYLVIKGMLGAFERWSPRPTILCEVAWGEEHPAWDEELAAFAALGDLGYRPVDLSGRPVDPSLIRATTDILFLPPHLEQPVREDAGDISTTAAT